MTTYATLPRSFIHTRVAPRRQQRVSHLYHSPSAVPHVYAAGEAIQAPDKQTTVPSSTAAAGGGEQGGPGSLDGLWALAGRWQWRRLRGGS